MRQGAWGHRVVLSRCIDWGTSRVEQVQACPQNPLGSAVAFSTQRKEVAKVNASHTWLTRAWPSAVHSPSMVGFPL